MNQTLLSCILFFLSAVIWAVLAFVFEDLRWLNLLLFAIFLVLAIAQLNRYKHDSELEDDSD
ncbi:hypothetical protein MUN89_17165 [Halobacillus salinarum]|uniref:Uncharacterized protein n=1 Tax=Halobacillus salinarum TaxID=2932257 RepID=A0ABY4EHS3_9BACI|nr:hypothetical protein [Halobacillus salinarum]UOQ43618.1 hypothetical protein MUN89_17165 [Halobacillus salinarum]